MMRETIIEIIERAFERELHWEAKATDELFELIEQEKKEVAKDILSKMQYALENPEASKDFAVYTLRLIAKEYGVEL